MPWVKKCQKRMSPITSNPRFREEGEKKILLEKSSAHVPTVIQISSFSKVLLCTFEMHTMVLRFVLIKLVDKYLKMRIKLLFIVARLSMRAQNPLLTSSKFLFGGGFDYVSWIWPYLISEWDHGGLPVSCYTLQGNDQKKLHMNNVSLGASVQGTRHYFSFRTQSWNKCSQIAFVTFKDTRGDDTALLLLGATFVDLSVTITPAPDYQPRPAASAPPAAADGTSEVAQKAKERAGMTEEQKIEVVDVRVTKSRRVFTSAAWITSTFNKVAKVTDEVVQKAKKKAGITEEQKIDVVDVGVTKSRRCATFEARTCSWFLLMDTDDTR